MSDSNTILTQANVPTIAAVGLVLGLLAVSFDFYLHRQIMASTAISMTMDVNASKKNDELKKEVVALNERIAALEGKALANTTTAAAVAPAEPAH